MDFVGLSARLTGKITAKDRNTATIETAFGPIRAKTDAPVGATALAGVRPELISVGEGENRISATLEDIMVLGSKTVLHGRASGEDRVLCELPGIRSGLSRGETVTFGWDIADTLAYEVAP
jgi:putative spermidine/putrescine transport system ATP-binding protein